VTERDHVGGGGLTGATGDLTFEEDDRPFVTGEAREASDPERKADVTAAQIRRAPAQRGETGDPRTARHPSAGEEAGKPADPASAQPDAKPRIGGDELTDQEEHL
jgi:hypothetical protein